jgi:hypothetical protein
MTTPDGLNDAFESLRTITPPAAAYTAIRAVQGDIRPVRASAWRRRPATRTLAVATAVLAIGGTATAAVTGSGPFSSLETSATTDAPAARNLGVLLRALDTLPEQGDLRRTPNADGTYPEATRSPVTALDPGHGPIRGTTVTRDGVSVDIALNDTRICLGTAGPRTQSPTPDAATARADTERALPPLVNVPRATDPAALACFPRSAANDALPSISGRDAHRIWLTTVVPDGIRDLTLTANDGQTATPTVTDNIAIATIPGAERLETLTWTKADGSKATQDLSVTPRSSAPTVRRLAPR